MSLSPLNHLKHILDEIEFLRRETCRMTLDSFLQDECAKRAFTRSIEIIGEAVKNLPSEFREKHHSVQWRYLAGMRDKLVHHYFGIDYEIVWDVVANKTAPL